MPSQEAELPADLSTELRRRGGSGNSTAGLAPLLTRLQEAAEKREGTPEELATLFVALLRATGCLTRLVRCLNCPLASLRIKQNDGSLSVSDNFGGTF